MLSLRSHVKPSAVNSKIMLITGPCVYSGGQIVSSSTFEPNDSCCGLCTVDYPEGQIYYWPAEAKNTWCMPYHLLVTGPIIKRHHLWELGLEPALGETALPGPCPATLMWFRQIWLFARHVAPLKATPLRPANNSLRKWREALGNATLTAAGFDQLSLGQPFYHSDRGLTFQSPSVYIIFVVVSATNQCRHIGHIYTSLTLSFAPRRIYDQICLSQERRAHGYVQCGRLSLSSSTA